MAVLRSEKKGVFRLRVVGDFSYAVASLAGEMKLESRGAGRLVFEVIWVKEGRAESLLRIV